MLGGFYEAYTIRSGWTCGSCGAWVLDNEFHTCPGSFPSYPSWPPIINIPFTPAIDITTDPFPPIRDNELHDKLDEILKLLRRLT